MKKIFLSLLPLLFLFFFVKPAFADYTINISQIQARHDPDANYQLVLEIFWDPGVFGGASSNCRLTDLDTSEQYIATVGGGNSCHFNVDSLPDKNHLYRLTYDFTPWGQPVRHYQSSTDFTLQQYWYDMIDPGGIELVSLSDQTITQYTTFNENISIIAHDSASSWSGTVDYGDGTGVQPLTINEQSFTLNHTYTTAGLFTVLLVMNNNLGSTLDRHATVQVLMPPNCDYTIGPPDRRAPYVSINIQNLCPQQELLGNNIADFGYYTFTTEQGSYQTEPFPFDPNTTEFTFYTDTSTGNILYDAHLVFTCDGNPCASLLLYDNPEGLILVSTPSINPLSGGTIAPGETYTENGSFEDDGSYSWNAFVDYGDGTGVNGISNNGTTFVFNHTYADPGIYTVIITVTDEGGLTGTGTTTVTVTDPQPVTVTFTPSGDSYVRSGQNDHNYGAGTFMNIQSSGNNRSIVKFDQSELQNTIGSGTVLSATLQVTITDNGNNWGSTGRTVDIHRMVAAWDEGNGTENSRGTGNGNTWNCATDSNIANQAKNCSGSTEWEMGQPNNPAVHPWTATATDTKTITNNQTGVVEYDVTSDVTSFMNGTNNYGWLLKKTNEGQNGQVSFGTRESSSVPQLVVTYQP